MGIAVLRCCIALRCTGKAPQAKRCTGCGVAGGGLRCNPSGAKRCKSNALGLHCFAMRASVQRNALGPGRALRSNATPCEAYGMQGPFSETGLGLHCKAMQKGVGAPSGPCPSLHPVGMHGTPNPPLHPMHPYGMQGMHGTLNPCEVL